MLAIAAFAAWALFAPLSGAVVAIVGELMYAENLFIVRHGKLVTPPATSNILEGVTRTTVIQLAREDLVYTTSPDPLPAKHMIRWTA